MYPAAYIDYLVHFHGDRDYFECHEILEEYWKGTDDKKDSIWVGLIMLAVGNYHHRRKNYAGAYRILQKAKDIFLSKETQCKDLSIDFEELLLLINSQLDRLNKGLPYQSYNLPLMDEELVNMCILSCERSGLKWCEASNISDRQLIHRHTLRDRSEVVKERENAQERKNQKRQ